MKRSGQFLTALLLTASVTFAGHALAAQENAATQQAHKLFADYWQYQMEDSPESATYLGDNRYADRWHDVSPAAVARRKAWRAGLEKKLAAIDAGKLGTEDRISLDVLRFDTHSKKLLDDIFGGLPFSADDQPFLVTQMDGLQLQLPQLIRATSLKSENDYRMLIKRLAGVPVLVDQQIALLRAGMKSGWMPAAVSIASVPSQFDLIVNDKLDANPLYRPFTAMAATLGVDQQNALRNQAGDILLHQSIPALRKMQAFLASEYLPAASANIAASQLPGKLAYYQAMLINANTTLKTPAEIHQIGLDEVARLEKEMADVMRESGFTGTPEEFNHFLNTDPQFFFTTPEAMLAAYRDIAKRIDPRLPEQFVTLPRLPYGIRAMLPSEGDGAEHYSGGTLDGSRAGYFEANVNNLKRRASWSMEDLVLHETVPGHHLQIARAGELSGLPMFRRAYGNSGYAEGWALYAESLGSSLGLYTTPYTRYGYLSSQVFRACRLVVDTGIHAFGMTRDEAIDYLVRHAAVTHDFAVAEVDRYIVWPGQATGYKLGQLDIIAMRHEAEQKLGAGFDVRQFHNEVIDHGGLPLAVLDAQLRRWMVSQQSAKH